MQIWDPVVRFFTEFSTNFRYPDWLWWIPILILVISVLVTRNFVRYSLDEIGRKKQRRMRLLIWILRSLAVTAIIIALAAPITTITQESEGNPKALLLIDESGSMDSYDTSFVEFLTEELSRRLPTTVKTFGTETESPVGDAALGHTEHLLMITDGNANRGVALSDVAQVARQNNKTINAIELSSLKYDAAVMVDAPRTVPLGFPADIRVVTTGTNEDPIPLTVSVDGRQVYSDLARGTIQLDQELPAGYHTIEATITGDDSNPDNNVHYKVVEILEKPRVFILTGQNGPFEAAVSGLFDVTTGSSLPRDLSPYYSVIINDRSASNVRGVDRLADFLRDDSGDKQGNGLVVVGGFNSYDRGGYQNTQLESLLPVKVGKPKRELGDNNLVFVIQISGSTSGSVFVSTGGGGLQEIKEDVPTIDIIKAQAVNALNSLNLRNNVGVVVFGASTEGESYGSADEAIAASVVQLKGIEPLYKHHQETLDKVSMLQGGGTTAPDLALRAAVDMLKNKGGSKTIVLLSNGRFSAGLGDLGAGAKSDVESIIGNAYRQYGITTHVIGVGSSDLNEEAFTRKVDEEFLINMAIRSDGLYDRATNMARLTLEYGDPDEKGFGEDFSLVTLSLTHFITRDLDLSVILNGYNEVAPKDGSRILVKTDGGAPALTVWNYFNGRVASLNVFTASGLGPLLSGENSDLVRNTILWSVGDPRRKQDVTVSVESAIVGQETEVTFISDEPISGTCEDTQVEFSRSLGNAYVFTFTPDSTGIKSVCGIPYAVNHPSEHWRVGVSQDLRDAVAVSDGQFFNFEQVDEIVDRIKTVSTRVSLERTEVRGPFIAIGIMLFLLEIFIRRLTRTGVG